MDCWLKRNDKRQMYSVSQAHVNVHMEVKGSLYMCSYNVSVTR